MIDKWYTVYTVIKDCNFTVSPNIEVKWYVYNKTALWFYNKNLQDAREKVY